MKTDRTGTSNDHDYYYYCYFYYLLTITSMVTVTSTIITSITIVMIVTTNSTTITTPTNTITATASMQAYRDMATVWVKGAAVCAPQRVGPLVGQEGGVQWKQGVVIYMMLHTSLLYQTTPSAAPPSHCTPPVMNTHSGQDIAHQSCAKANIGKHR